MVKEAKVMFDKEKQPLCSNNISLGTKPKIITSCICRVAVCGSETGTVWNMKRGS